MYFRREIKSVMKFIFNISSIILNLILIQPLNGFAKDLPEKMSVPLDFGTDVVAHYDPDFADLNCDIAVAFNGWIYIAYSTSHSGPSGIDIGFAVSKDSGLTWQAFPPLILGSHNEASVYDLLVTGTDTSSLRVYLSYYYYNNSFPYAFGHVAVYDGISGSILPYGIDIGNGYYKVGDIRLATDYQNPAVGSTGYSVAIVYTTGPGDLTVTDSLVCLIASDKSSTSFNYNLLDSSSSVSIRGASVDYGYSSNWNNGQYFVAYQKGLALAYCRNSFSITSGFTVPILLNDLIGSSDSSFDSPKIVCQNSKESNDSSGLSVMIMTKALDSLGTNTYRIPWIIYNKQAAVSDFWFSSGVMNSVNNFSLETFDISYSEAEDRFFLAGYNSDSGSLFLRQEDFNFSHPDNWFVINNQYNDSVIDPSWPPNPRVTINGNFAFTAWESRTLGSIGQPRAQTLFDRQTLPIVTEVQTINNNHDFKVYPNPANNEIYIFSNSLKNSKNEKSVKIVDSAGRIVFSKKYNSQGETIRINTQEFINGIYFLQIIVQNEKQINLKFLIHHY